MCYKSVGIYFACIYCPLCHKCIYYEIPTHKMNDILQKGMVGKHYYILLFLIRILSLKIKTCRFLGMKR